MIKFQKLKYSSNKRMQERIFPKPLIQQNVLNGRMRVVIEKRGSSLCAEAFGAQNCGETATLTPHRNA